MSGKRIAVIGNGGREYALCWKLSQSDHVSSIYAIPGNGGTMCLKKVHNIDIDVNNMQNVIDVCLNTNVDIAIVGSEVPLANGLSDLFWNNNIMCFGPKKEAAIIETNKEWSKNFMNKYNIPTASWKSFTNPDDAKQFVRSASFNATVIKAAGLAGGKGVIVADNIEHALDILDNILVCDDSKGIWKNFIIEERLDGDEISVLAFCDGKTVKLMLPAQDHKRLLNNDRGPNTGGMGAFCPYNMSSEDTEFVKNHILQKAIDGLTEENKPFIGVLYAGLMLTKNGIMVLEFNCRFGDPETQVILPMLKTDLYEIILACCNGTLDKTNITWKSNLNCVGVVMASEGYPEPVKCGYQITVMPEVLNMENIYVFHASTSLKGNMIVSSGGRVLNVIAMDNLLEKASAKALMACRKIIFTGCQYRTDIAYKGILNNILTDGIGSYSSAGVDISLGNYLIKKIKKPIESTFSKDIVSEIGSFGAVTRIDTAKYKEPMLVSSCDGVGTKLKIAQSCKVHRYIGIDLVAMCVNDILAHGAKPLFMLDYFACGKLDAEITEDVINGVVNGCRIAECALVGGETAEMPGFYEHGEYDIGGFVVGIVEKSNMLPSFDIMKGDKIIYLSSEGLHSNGFSLLRKIVSDNGLQYTDPAPFSTGKTLGEEFLKPTRIYVKEVLQLIDKKLIKGFAHITGGGLIENIPRILPPNTSITIDAAKWNIPPIFGWISAIGKVNETEMLRTFNCGVGGIVVVSAELENDVCAALNSNVIGYVDEWDEHKKLPRINILNFSDELKIRMAPFIPIVVDRYISDRIKKRVAVLISGTGTNLKALIQKLNFDDQADARISLVISSKENVTGIKIAKEYGIPVLVIKRDRKLSLELNDHMIHAALHDANIDLVCLAGYMHILSEEFVKKWRGKMINIHPSLLPSFKGLRAQKQAMEAGVKITGCTVHFVEAEVDGGAIIDQGSVPVFPTDTEEILVERIKEVEHVIYPRALGMVASGKVNLDLDTGVAIWNE